MTDDAVRPEVGTEVSIGVTSAGEGRLTIGVRMIDSRWIVGRDDPSRSRGQLRRGIILNATRTANSDEVEYQTQLKQF